MLFQMINSKKQFKKMKYNLLIVRFISIGILCFLLKIKNMKLLRKLQTYL